MPTDAKDLIERFKKAKHGRVNWESYWQEVSEYVQPSFSNTFFTEGYSMSPGSRRDRKRVDGSGEIALGRFAAAMESMISPRNSRYQQITTDNPDLNKIARVRLWFDAATDALFKYRYEPSANFASQCQEHYRSLGAYGTAGMFIDRLAPRGLRYSEIHISQLFFYENFQGIVDEVMRPFKLTARNAVQKFGADILSADIQRAASQAPHDTFEFLHIVMPNYEYDPQRADWRGKKFVSFYIEMLGQTILKTEGYHTFPYAISRYTTAPGEIYGRGPAMTALTNIKVLNEQKKTILKQGHRTVDPVLLTHDDGVIDTFSLRPGSAVPGALTADGKPLVQTLPVGNLAVGDKMMEMEKAEINAAFLVDLFQILMDGPEKTATEVIELAREKGIMLSPTMGRQETEFLGFMTEREIDLLMQQNLLPPMPPELVEANGEYTISYDSPLSRAQKAEQAAGLMRTVQWASEVANLTQNPAPLDHFNFDVIIPELSQIQAVPFRWMATDAQVQAARASRSQQQATQQMIDAGPTVAALSKNMQQ